MGPRALRASERSAVMERRRIIAVASALAAIVVVVFVLSAQDTSVVREQGAATTSMPNGMRLAGSVSETVPENVQAETSPASVLLEDELTPAPSEHPADLDQSVWNKYTAAKDNAEVTVSADEFRAMEDSCMHTRKHAALDCGQLYCAAEAECGKPCEKPYGMPPVQVVPLQPGGPKFHRVAEVDRKERANKELHAKEVAAKERAVKEHAEKAKEKAAKEVDYKKKLDEEKSSKESTMKAHAAEEASTKHGLEGEISMKENQVKMNFTAMETYVSNQCVVKGEKARVTCDEEKQEKLAEEVATKEVAIKAALAKNESDDEDVYAVGNGTAELHDLADDIGHSESIIGNASTAGPHLYNPAGADTVSPTPAPTSHCELITTSIDCIASYGCHYDVDAGHCVDGFIPGEFVNATETEQQIDAWDPLNALENCVNDDAWGNGNGQTCDEVDVAYCQEHGTETFPGFGCDTDGTGCKTAMEACCICQIEFSSATAQCTDDASFRNEEGLSCSDVTFEWCQIAGNNVYPGFGCAEDGHDCLSGFEACCVCQTGGDLAATGKGTGDLATIGEVPAPAPSSPTSAPTTAPTYSPDLSPSFDGFFLDGVWKGCYSVVKSYQTESPSAHYGKNRMTIMSFDGLPPASMIASATLKLKKTWDGSKHSWSGCPSSNNYEFKQVTTSGLDDSCDGQANSARGYNFGSTKTKKTISASLGAKSVDLTSFVQSLAGTGTSNSISFSIAGVSKGCLSAFAAHEATAEADRPTLELTFNEETDANTLQHGDVIHLKNMYGSGSYLDTCNHAKCSSSTKYQVSTSTLKNRDNSGTGKWTIERVNGDGPVRNGDVIHLKNHYGSGSYLDTCNHAKCSSSTKYQVSTSSLKNRDSGTGKWTV